jgi:serine/threonine protein kinase/tetratricopeptide (TPR) repeat protein/WD40 repeat protein
MLASLVPGNEPGRQSGSCFLDCGCYCEIKLDFGESAMLQDCPGTEELARWLVQDLPASKLGLIEAHIETCARCQSAVEKLLAPRAEKKCDGEKPTGLAAEARFLQRVAMQKPATFEAVTALLAPLPNQPPSSPPVLKDYDILEEIGRGGMGIVYKTRQRHLNRPVAIKMVLLEASAKPEILVRFHQEAELAARLLHPNIVQVHEIRHQEQNSFLVMELVEGSSLSRKCDKRPQPAMEAARLVEVLARAIEYAHRKGVLHRDLKPSNILLTADGVAKIADFGLATCIGLETGLTATGSLLGTPEYMAPEQANQRQRQIGPATDVYGLGAILYELLTGRPPITGTDLMDVLVRLREEEVISLRRLQPSVPRDLETVCLKCLQKDPRQRYPSAEALADDLLRFLNGKPTLARPVSMPERAWRWSKRNPSLAGTLSAVTILLIVLAVGSFASAVLFRGERNRALEAEEQAHELAGQTEVARREIQELLVKNLQSVAGEVRAMRLRGERGAYFRGMPKLRATLAQARAFGAPQVVIRTIRNEMGNLLTTGDLDVTREWDDETRGGETAVFASNLMRYARFRIDGLLTVHETGTGKEVCRLPRLPRPSWHVRLSSDGQLLLRDAGDKQVVCWSLETAKATQRWTADGTRGWLSPSGSLALYVALDHKTQVVDAQSGLKLRRLPQGEPADGHPIHPGRPWVALSDGKNLVVVDYQTGHRIGELPGINGNVCWHPTSPVIAVASRVRGERIYVWDVMTGRQMMPPFLGYTDGGTTPVFDRTGRFLLTTEWSGIIRAWDAVTGRLIFHTLLQPSHTHIAFGPDDEVGAAVHRQKVQLFRIYPGEGLRVIVPPEQVFVGLPPRLAAEPNGQVVAIYRRENRTTFFDAEDGRELGMLPGNAALATSARTDGSLLTVGTRGTERWPVRIENGVYQVGPPEVLAWLPNNHDYWGMSGDGDVVGAPGYSAGVFVWDRKRAAPPHPIAPQRDVRFVALSPDGRWLVAGDYGPGEVSVYDVRTGEQTRRLITQGGYAVFSPGGRWLGVTSYSGGATLFRAGTWESIRSLGDGALTFSSDDRLAAVGEGYGVIRLEETESGEEVSRLETIDQTRLVPLGFSPDGRRLYAWGQESRAVYIWDLRLIRARLKAMDADWDWPAFPPPPPADGARGRLEVRVVDAEKRDPERERALDLAALYVNPFDADAHFRLGKHLLAAKRYGPAHAHLGVALAFRRDLDEALYPRAVAAANLGKWKDACEDFTRHLAKHPNDGEAHHQRGHANEWLGKYREAIADFSAALERRPNDAHMLECRGENYLSVGQHAQAAADCLKSLEVQPEQANPNRNLAWIHANGPTNFRDLDKALSFARRAVTIGATQSRNHHCLGVVYYRLGRWQDSLEAFRKGLELRNGKTTAYYDFFLAMCHAQLGSVFMANEHYRQGVNWIEAQTTLPREFLEELKAVRAEAETVLKRNGR